MSVTPEELGLPADRAWIEAPRPGPYLPGAVVPDLIQPAYGGDRYPMTSGRFRRSGTSVRGCRLLRVRAEAQTRVKARDVRVMGTLQVL